MHGFAVLPWRKMIWIAMLGQIRSWAFPTATAAGAAPKWPPAAADAQSLVGSSCDAVRGRRMNAAISGLVKAVDIFPTLV